MKIMNTVVLIIYNKQVRISKRQPESFILVSQNVCIEGYTVYPILLLVN